MESAVKSYVSLKVSNAISALVCLRLLAIAWPLAYVFASGVFATFGRRLSRW